MDLARDEVCEGIHGITRFSALLPVRTIFTYFIFHQVSYFNFDSYIASIWVANQFAHFISSEIRCTLWVSFVEPLHHRSASSLNSSSQSSNSEGSIMWQKSKVDVVGTFLAQSIFQAQSNLYDTTFYHHKKQTNQPTRLKLLSSSLCVKRNWCSFFSGLFNACSTQ